MINCANVSTRQAQDYYEKDDYYTQKGQMPARYGIAYASFRHDTSRLGDPNLHTHNVILKVIIGSKPSKKP